MESGIKLIHEFDVAADQRVDLVLDFDACKSVVALGDGGYLLKPVIKVIPTELNGINGFVAASLLASNVTVSAQLNGAVVRSTVPVASTGSFFLARLAPGNYDVVITADSHATAVIAAVPVASSTSVVMVSTNSTPIALPVSTSQSISGNATLNPVSTTDEVIFVAAKQTFDGGPTVAVKSHAADVLSGDYRLTLSIAAPLRGQYGAGTLPIALAAQSALAGQYTVEASLIGYQTQSFGQEISTADVIQDFKLVQ